MKRSRSFLVLFTFITMLIVIGLASRPGKQRPPQVRDPQVHGLGAKSQPETSREYNQDITGDLRQIGVPEMAKLSTRIVLAECLSVEMRELSGGNIFTFSRFEVIRVVKGEFKQGSFTLRVLGGRVGNVEITSPLSIKFNSGEKFVLFLGPDNVDGYPTIAAQGIFQVRINPVDKTEIVVPGPQGLRLFRANNDQPYTSPPELLPLEDFLFSLGKLN